MGTDKFKAYTMVSIQVISIGKCATRLHER
jgi:hypothetical protein